MSEPLPEPRAPRTTHEPVEPDAALAAKNVRFGIALFVVALLVAGAAVLISFVYLHYD